MMPRNDRRQDIEGLRGIAVLAVLLFHAGYPWFGGGFVGVDVFFVISGFVITGMLGREIESSGTISLRRFYAGRIKRLLPAFALTIALTFAAGFLFFAPAHFFDLSASSMYAAAAIPNFYFWQQSGYFDISSAFRPLLHTWSLGVEQQFYLVWPVLLIIAARLPFRHAAPAIVAVVGVVSLWLDVHYDVDAEAIFYLPWFRGFEFAIGAGIYWLDRYRPNGWAGEAISVSGAVLVAWAVLRFNETMVFPSVNALVPTVGAALIIFGGGNTWVGRELSRRSIVFVGSLSYSLYLVHWPLLVFWHYVKFNDLTNLDRGLIIAIAFALAWLMYRYVEMPIHRGAKAKRLSPSVLGILGGATMGIIAVVAYLPWSDGGWQFRAGDAAKNYPVLASLGEVAFRKDQYGGSATTPDFEIGLKPPTILIAGDSHSRQYFAGLTDLYPPSENGFRVIDQGSCIFRLKRCDDFDAIVQRFVAQEKDGLLFISQRWNFHKHIALHFGQNAVGHTSAATLATFYADRIAAMFDIYALPPRQKIYIMGATPEVNTLGDVATCLLRPVFFAATRDCETASAQEKGIAFRRKFNELLSSQITRLNRTHGWNIAFGDPFDVLCSSDLCEQVDNGHILYNDHDHLSIDGSKRVIVSFSKQLLDFFPAREPLR